MAHGQPHGGELIAHLGLGQHLGQGFGEAVDHGLGGTGRGKVAVVGDVFKAGQPQFGKGRHIGHHGLTRTTHHGHHPDLAGLVVFDEIGY